MNLRKLEEHSARPFPAYPQVDRYFPASTIESARRRITQTIERGDGPALVIGGPGTGKSLLLQVLAAQFHPQLDVVLLACARLCTRRCLLQAILFELGLPYQARDEGALRLSLLDRLLSQDECPSGLLLLVDEAQTLSPALLDELRVLTNLVRGGMPRVRLVLAGSSALEETFADPALESFSQRLSARCYLSSLGREQTKQYIRAQLANSSVSSNDLFTADAIDAIFDATEGVPRLVNQLCDRAMQFANDEARDEIDSAVVQHAWSDLQQLPAPWDTPVELAASANVESVVEFGGLSEDQAISTDVPTEERDLIEPTEIDFEDEEILPAMTMAESQTLAAEPEEEIVADPFIEEFVEEEVVLDNFAAWDDLFRRELPRVENRRDPSFTTLVQSVIDTSPVLVVQESKPTPPVLEMRMELEVEAGDEKFAEEEREEERFDKEITAAVLMDRFDDWPPLRIVAISDPTPLKPIELLPPTTDARAAGPTKLDTLPCSGAKVSCQPKPDSEPPVLVIEDDLPQPTKLDAPVRREEYRNLFSRLRSG